MHREEAEEPAVRVCEATQGVSAEPGLWAIPVCACCVTRAVTGRGTLVSYNSISSQVKCLRPCHLDMKNHLDDN